jgi:probable phosphoglycerate mutase
MFVTMMAYLNDEWREEWHAETLFADPETGTGVFVQPRPGRCAGLGRAVGRG